VDRSFSVSTAPFDGYDLSVAISEIARLGIRYVEPAFIQGYTDPFGEEVFSAANAKRISRLLQEGGVSCFAFSAHMDLGSDDAVSIFTRRMEFARRVGAQVIVTNAALAEKRTSLLKNMQRLARTAESLDLVIGLENPGDGRPNVVNGGTDGALFIRELASDAVRLNYDFGNIVSHFFERRRPEEDFKEALPYCAHLHIKDVGGNEDGWYFTEIGRGSIDYDVILKHLSAEHDMLPVSLEIPLRVTRAKDASPRRRLHPIPLDHIHKTLRNSVDYVRARLRGA
jgi:sugar phosphate isomerase/epimerase